MTVKKQPTTENVSAAVEKSPASFVAVIRTILSKTPDIDAVFLLTDDVNVVHIFSVVKEFQARIYDKLLRKERALEIALPEIAFEFHVRAHQGRQPAQAVPFQAKLVYAR